MAEEKTLVRHYMTSPINFLTADMTLEQAERLFSDMRLHTAPVLVDRKNVLGVMSDFTLLKCFLIRNGEPSKTKIKDFLYEFDPAITIDENEPIINAFRLMTQSPSHRIYVSSGESIQGALSPKDILPFLAGEAAIDRHKEDKDLIAAQIRIKSLMKQLGETQSELDRYQQVFISSPFMVHALDLKGNILMANPMIHQILGYETDELVGKHLTDLYPAQFHKAAEEGIQKIQINGFHPLINTSMVKKTKELVLVDIASTARTDHDGRIVGTVTIGRLSNSSLMLEALSQIGHALKTHLHN
jgi:PAS domain S-box-containing protein